MATFNLAAALATAETGGRHPLWRRFPKTARELLQHVFGLCVIIAGLGSLIELVRYGDARKAGLFLLVCYLTTCCFPAVYGCYAKNVDGESSSDWLNGRSVTTGRAAFRFMSMWCVMVLFGWAVYFLISLNTVMVGSSLMGVFVTVFLVAMSTGPMRKVPLPADQGIKGS